MAMRVVPPLTADGDALPMRDRFEAFLSNRLLPKLPAEVHEEAKVLSQSARRR